MKDSKDRFFDEEKNARKDWIFDRMDELIKKNPNGMGEILNEIFSKNQDFMTEDKLYSNDFMVNRIMQFFIDKAEKEIQDHVKKIWIGKNEEKGESANAGAYFLDPNYEGYLITFNFELEFIIRQVSEVFAAYITLVKFKPSKESPLNKDLIRLIFYDIDLIRDWTLYDFSLIEQLQPDVRKFYNNKCIEFYLWGTAFVVAHEIGHHFLKHTATNNLISNYITRNFDGKNELHKLEFAADTFAVEFMLRNLYNDEPNEGYVISIEYLSGPLIGIIAIALLSDDADEESETHPSIRERWNNVRDIIEQYCTKDEFETLIPLVDTVNGLIQKHLKHWKAEWWK